MKTLAGISLVIGILLSVTGIAVMTGYIFYAVSALLYLGSTPIYGNPSNQGDDSYFAASAATVASNTFDNDDDDIGSISSTLPELETMHINPATGMPMMGGIGGIDAAGNLYGSDSMSDMTSMSDIHSGINDTSMFSDDFTSSTNDFDSFDTTSSFDDNTSSFDDSFSSMSDDW